MFFLEKFHFPFILNIYIYIYLGQKQCHQKEIIIVIIEQSSRSGSDFIFSRDYLVVGFGVIIMGPTNNATLRMSEIT